MLSGAKARKSCRSRQELSYELLLAKIGVDTAENEPLKVTDSAAVENTELVVSRLLDADLVDGNNLGIPLNFTRYDNQRQCLDIFVDGITNVCSWLALKKINLDK